MKDLKRLLVEAKPLYSSLAIIALLSLFNTFINLATPWLYRELINFLTTHKLSAVFAKIISNDSELVVLLWLVGIFSVIDVIASVTGEIIWYMQSTTSMRSWYTFLNKSVQKLHEFSVNYFEKKSPGWLRERIHAGVNEIYGIARSILVDILPMIINFAIASIVLYRFDYKLSLVLVISVPLYVVISIWRAKIMRYWEKKIRSQMEKSGKAFHENIYHYQLIKEFSQEEYEQKRLDAIYQRAFNLRRKQESILRVTGVLRQLLYNLVDLWVYGYGGYLVLTGKLNVGDLVLFMAYLGRVMGPLGGVFRIYDSIQIGFVSIKRLFGIWDREDDIQDLPDARPLKIKAGSIEFKNVGFDYTPTKSHKGERMVFRNLNLKIKPNEIVALVGPSGAGKSTFIKLLLRFYDPKQGQILIDGEDIKNVTQTSLRQNVSAVMQDVMVFNNTIGYNLKYGRLRANQNDIESAARIANLYDFIVSLRQKFKTRVGERGIRLSGGERQRLAIARALLKNAPILVMDEATSALDSENEKKIQEAMWELIKGRTTIIIAHRLSTIKRVARIIVFDQKGKIIEQGNHEELMLKEGYYNRLFKMQGEFFSA